MQHYLINNFKPVPDTSQRPARLKVLEKHGLLEKPVKDPKPKPGLVKRTTKVATGRPVIRLPTTRLKSKDNPEISSNWVSSSSGSSHSNYSDLVSSSSAPQVEIPSPRRSTRSQNMLQCQVRVRRLEDDDISFNELSRTIATKRCGACSTSGA